MSAFTPEQWAAAGEATLRHIHGAQGLPVTDADVREARDTAVYIATGKKRANAGQDE